jgi:hypothetical protein
MGLGHGAQLLAPQPVLGRTMQVPALSQLRAPQFHVPPVALTPPALGEPPFA